jgi:hypothetical protein
MPQPVIALGAGTGNRVNVPIAKRHASITD